MRVYGREDRVSAREQVRYQCLAAVPPDRTERLHALDPVVYRWTGTATWADTTVMIRRLSVDLVVLDPLMQGEAGIPEVEALRGQFPSLPLLLYTALSPATAPILLRLGRLGIRRVIFARFEDAPENLRRAIAKELEYTALQQVIRSLDTVLRALPAMLRQAVEMALREPADGVGTVALARQAGMTPHECQAWFRKACLPAPRIVLALVRLLYAHRLLLDPGHTIEDVAGKLGYRKVHTLQAQLRTAFGMTAAELRRSLSPEEATAILTERYLTPTTRAVDAVSLTASNGY